MATVRIPMTTPADEALWDLDNLFEPTAVPHIFCGISPAIDPSEMPVNADAYVGYVGASPSAALATADDDASYLWWDSWGYRQAGGSMRYLLQLVVQQDTPFVPPEDYLEFVRLEVTVRYKTDPVVGIRRSYNPAYMSTGGDYWGQTTTFLSAATWGTTHLDMLLAGEFWFAVWVENQGVPDLAANFPTVQVTQVYADVIYSPVPPDPDPELTEVTSQAAGAWNVTINDIAGGANSRKTYFAPV